VAGGEHIDNLENHRKRFKAPHPLGEEVPAHLTDVSGSIIQQIHEDINQKLNESMKTLYGRLRGVYYTELMHVTGGGGASPSEATPAGTASTELAFLKPSASLKPLPPPTAQVSVSDHEAPQILQAEPTRGGLKKPRSTRTRVAFADDETSKFPVALCAPAAGATTVKQGRQQAGDEAPLDDAASDVSGELLKLDPPSKKAGGDAATIVAWEDQTNLETDNSLSMESTFSDANGKPKLACNEDEGSEVDGSSSESAGSETTEAFLRDSSKHCMIFEVLEVWKKGSKHMAAKMGVQQLKHAGSKATMASRAMTTNLEGLEEALNSHRAQGIWAKLVLEPNSKSRFLWEALSTLMVFYDLIWLPLLVFDPPETLMTAVMTWVCRLFWTSDIGMSSLTGFTTNDGILETRPLVIFRRYFKTWFPLDVVIVIVDWLELIFDEAQGGSVARIGRVSRGFRIARMVRLLRVLRLQDLFTNMMDTVRSESLKEMSVMVKIVLLVFGSGHLFACLWYGLGVQDPDEEHTWVRATFSARHSLGYRYTTSLHWSLSQFSGGLDDIQPENLYERVYAVATWIYAFMAGAIMISALTSSLTQLNILANEKATKMNMLRKYLADNGISTRLATRVQRNAQHLLLERQRLIPEGSVELLQLVSTPLRVELHFELYFPVFRNHPFFARFTEVCLHIMQKVCHSATTTMSVSQGDIVFNVGEIPQKPKVVFLMNGALNYVTMSEMAGLGEIGRSPSEILKQNMTRGSKSSGLRDTGFGTTVIEGEWLAEPFLWTHWMCRGLLCASTDSRLVLLDAGKFQDTVSAFNHSEFNPKVYAGVFVEELNDLEDLSDITSGIELTSLSKVDEFMERKMKRSRAGSHRSAGSRVASGNFQKVHP